MNNQLKNKIMTEGTLADELVNTQGYQHISKKMAEKEEYLLKEALNSQSMEALSYTKGFIEGLRFFKNEVDTMIRLRENLKKRN
jgi:hypothetical protein